MQFCDNIDEYIINQRQILYHKSKKDTFIRHSNVIVFLKKICICIGSIYLSKLND